MMSFLTSFTRGERRFTVRRKTFYILMVAMGLLFWVLYQSAVKEKVLRLGHRFYEDTMSRYNPPPESEVTGVGRRLEIAPEFWNRMIGGYDRLRTEGEGLIDRLTLDQAKDFVFVTAASSSFYVASLGAIRTVQQLFPGRRIFFYDLEGSQNPNEFVQQKVSAVCGVTYRRFNFSLYPDHVRQLRFYAWKPLIVYEMLVEFSGVLWIDSSIRFEKNNITTILTKASTNGGLVALTSTGHSNFAVTHPQMFVFLPTSRDGMIKSIQHEANCVLFYRTEFTITQVVWWWALCALDPLCIAPTSQTACENPYLSPSIYANCHRFDQSALNILLANQFAYDDTRYFEGVELVKVHRMSNYGVVVNVCPPGDGSSTTGVDSSNYLEMRRFYGLKTIGRFDGNGVKATPS